MSQPAPRPSGAARLRLITFLVALLALLAGVAGSALGGLYYLDRPHIQTARQQAQRAAETTVAMEGRMTTAETKLAELDKQVSTLRFQNLLLKASVRIARARTHLAEKQGGLAIRELAEVERALDAAAKLGSPGQQEQIAEIKKLMSDLKNAIEGSGTFPIQTVEILGERIDAMIRE
jgi:hypothetical protein